MKHIAAFDADDTLFEGFCIFPLYEAMTADGLVRQDDNERLQEVLGQYNAHQLPYGEFVQQTLAVAAFALKDLSEEAVQRAATDYFRSPAVPWFGYVKPSLDKLHAHDFKTVVITAEPNFVAVAIADALDMYAFFGTEFPVDANGRFEGVVGQTLGRARKGEIASGIGHGTAQFIAAGDSDGDIAMLEAATSAHCIKPTDELRAHAKDKPWRIIEDPHEVRNIFRIV